MRWFKHFSDALDDPFIQELLDNFSHSGYVAWFGLLEIIAKENGTELTGKLTVDPRYLKRKLRISTAKLEQIFDFCSRKVEENLNKTLGKPKLLFNKTSGIQNKTLEKWSFEVCKMLELKDNYTKDLQGSGKKLSNHKEVEVEEEVEEEKNYSEDSDEFRLSLFLLNNIRKRKPDFKIPNLQTWTKQSDYILRIDRRDLDEVKKVVIWVQSDEFWQDNILSTAKLRKQYDQLVLKMGKVSTSPKDKEFDEQFSHMMT